MWRDFPAQNEVVVVVLRASRARLPARLTENLGMMLPPI
jgi:hypothetical protein